jgi:chromate transporter
MAAAANSTPPSRSSAAPVALFFYFSKVGVLSFGGAVGPRLHKEFVEGRRWLSDAEFSTDFAVARMMPGANIVNLGALIGRRLMGPGGAVAAVLGLLVGPSLVAIGLVALADHWKAGGTLDAALQGVAASAAGLLLGMGLKTGGRMARMVFADGQAAKGISELSVLVAIFLLVGLLRLPMTVVVVCFAPFSAALAFLTGDKAANKGRG